MKKLLSLFGVLIFIGCIQAHAEKRRVTMEHWQTSNVDGSTTVRRSLMRIPIDVYYDDDLRQIEIYGEEDMDVQYTCVMRMEILLPILQLLIPYWMFLTVIVDYSPYG